MPIKAASREYRLEVIDGYVKANFEVKDQE
jgi:hypothetical protein